MRQVRYGVAMILDGYIAGPHGGADWTVLDPDPNDYFASYMSRLRRKQKRGAQLSWPNVTSCDRSRREV